MGYLLMCILQLRYARCCHGNQEIKGDFCSFEYFHLLILPNTSMKIFKLKITKKTAEMSLTNNEISREAMHYG